MLCENAWEVHSVPTLTYTALRLDFDYDTTDVCGGCCREIVI